MLTFGTDPEFLITENGVGKSAIDVIGRGIENPIEIDGARFYYDNVLAECTVVPGKTKDESIENIRHSLRLFSEIVSPYCLEVRSSYEFDPKELDNPIAKLIGCSPESDSYTMMTAKPPKSEFINNTLRSAGGHVHLGNDLLKDKQDPRVVFSIYMLDLFVGIPSLFLDNTPESKARRTLYGKAGRFRDKPYGVEYRSLSNFWLKSPSLTDLIYDLCEFTVEFVGSDRMKDYWTFNKDKWFDTEDFPSSIDPHYDYNKVRNAIDNSNTELAKSSMPLLKKELPKKLFDRICDSSNIKVKSLKEEWSL